MSDEPAGPDAEQEPPAEAAATQQQSSADALHQEAAALEKQAQALQQKASALKNQASAINDESGETPKSKRRLIPLALSAFVLPGAGQCAQKRYFMGVLYMFGILASFFMLMVGLMKPLIHNWQYIFGNRFDEPEKTDWKRIGLGVLCFILIYAVNLLDVWWAEKRRAQKS